MNLFDLVVKVILAVDIIRDDDAMVRKLIEVQLSVDVDADVRCYLSGVRLDKNLRFFGIDLHLEAFVCYSIVTKSNSEDTKIGESGVYRINYLSSRFFFLGCIFALYAFVLASFRITYFLFTRKGYVRRNASLASSCHLVITVRSTILL